MAVHLVERNDRFEFTVPDSPEIREMILRGHYNPRRLRIKVSSLRCKWTSLSTLAFLTTEPVKGGTRYSFKATPWLRVLITPDMTISHNVMDGRIHSFMLTMRGGEPIELPIAKDIPQYVEILNAIKE